MSENKSKATKKHLKAVQAAKADILRSLESATKPILKKAGSPSIPGEIPIATRYPIVSVPITEEDRESLRKALQRVEEEERRVITELEAKDNRASVIKPARKQPRKR